MAMMRSMVPLRSSWARARTSVVTWRKRRFLLFQAVQFPRLRSGRAFGSPALDLLRVDIDELELLAMDTLDPIDGGVVEDMGLDPCFGQGLDVVAGVAEGAVDHAGDERHLADRLPVHGFGRGHAGVSLVRP